MNRKLALVLVACMVGALLLTAAGPIPENPLHDFSGTVSCNVTKEGTSDLKEKTHDTNWGQTQVCVLASEHDMAAGKLELENLWSEFNKKQKGAGYGVQKFRLTTADGTWEGYQITRVNNKGVQAVNGWGHGETGPYVGQKIWYRVGADGVIHGWCSEKPPEEVKK